MKKINLIALLLMVMLLFSGCAISRSNINKKNKENFSQIVDAIKTEDPSKIQSIFSENVVSSKPDFLEEIRQFIEYFEGDIISYIPPRKAKITASSSTSMGQVESEVRTVFIVKTTEKEYCIAFKEFYEYTTSPGSVGVLSLYATDVESVDTICDNPYAYNWTSGVNIGVDNRIEKSNAKSKTLIEILIDMF